METPIYIGQSWLRQEKRVHFHNGISHLDGWGRFVPAITLGVSVRMQMSTSDIPLLHFDFKKNVLVAKLHSVAFYRSTLVNVLLPELG